MVRRHFWRRLLPCIGVTTYMGIIAFSADLGAPALAAAAAFGLLTAREALRFRENLDRLRALEDVFEELA